MNSIDDVYLVTGAWGHIGSYVIEELSRTNKDCTIVCVDNGYNGFPDINLKKSHEYSKLNNIKIYYGENNDGSRCDIADYDMLRFVFQKFKPNKVFHQASMLTLDSKIFRRKAVEVNIVGFSNILDLCKEYSVEKVVYASSASVYGNPEIVPTSENHHFNQCKLLYGATKVADEYIARSYMYEENVDIIGLRYFNVYGYRQSTKNVYTQIVPKFINSIIDKKPVTIYGDGLQTMDLIHGRDIGNYNIRAMNSNLRNTFLNVGSGNQTTVIGLFNILCDMLDSKGIDTSFSRNSIVYESHDPNLVKSRCADVKTLHALLGKNSVSLEEGLIDTIDNIIHLRKK